MSAPGDHTACPGCGLLLPVEDGPTHPYIGASAACWARFGELLARHSEYPAGSRVRQLPIDAYAASHPGVPERRSIQSVAVHLMTLCLVVEDGADPRHGPKLHKRMVGHPSYEWLAPPAFDGCLTVLDVLAARDAEEHVARVWAWARQIWAAWAPHHATVRAWLEGTLPGVSGAIPGRGTAGTVRRPASTAVLAPRP